MWHSPTGPGFWMQENVSRNLAIGPSRRLMAGHPKRVAPFAKFTLAIAIIVPNSAAGLDLLQRDVKKLIYSLGDLLLRDALAGEILRHPIQGVVTALPRQIRGDELIGVSRSGLPVRPSCPAAQLPSILLHLAVALNRIPHHG